MEQAERQEYHRLLYVAMTRAEDRLYICGWEGLQRREEGKVWYDLVSDGLAGHLTAHADADGSPLHRMESAQTEPVTDCRTRGGAAGGRSAPRLGGRNRPN